MLLFCNCCVEQLEVPGASLLIPMHDGGSDFEKYHLCINCDLRMFSEHETSMVGFPINKAAIYITTATPESKVWVRYWPQEAARIALEALKRDHEYTRRR